MYFRPFLVFCVAKTLCMVGCDPGECHTELSRHAVWTDSDFCCLRNLYSVSANFNNASFGMDPSVLDKYGLRDTPKEWFYYVTKLLHNLLPNMSRIPWGLKQIFRAFKNKIQSVLNSGSHVDFSFHHVDHDNFFPNWMEERWVCLVKLLCLCFSTVYNFDLHVAAHIDCVVCPVNWMCFLSHRMPSVK